MQGWMPEIGWQQSAPRDRATASGNRQMGAHFTPGNLPRLSVEITQQNPTSN
jgi:hypothetical protein